MAATVQVRVTPDVHQDLKSQVFRMTSEVMHCPTLSRMIGAALAVAGRHPDELREELGPVNHPERARCRNT